MKKRNFAERSAMVAAFVGSELDEEAFSQQQGITVSSLRRWLVEAKLAPAKKIPHGGFVEVGGLMPSSIHAEVFRVVAREVAFEFKSTPSADWLGEFAATLVSGGKRHK